MLIKTEIFFSNKTTTMIITGKGFAFFKMMIPYLPFLRQTQNQNVACLLSVLICMFRKTDAYLLTVENCYFFILKR